MLPTKIVVDDDDDDDNVDVYNSEFIHENTKRMELLHIEKDRI